MNPVARPKLYEVRAQDGAEQETIALVQGEAFREMPKDLYIPPEALEVFLEAFEGPLDLLLYLIRRENLDILDIRVAEITEQYMAYIDLMSAMQLELAGDYLVMAAMLAEIKSRLLLPKPPAQAEDEDDPRAELIRRLQEYEQLKTAAEDLDALPRLERDIHLAAADKPQLVREHADPEVELREVLLALARVLKRAELYSHHPIHLEPLSVFTADEGRRGVVVTFLALMELVREGLVGFVQNEAYAPIYVKAAA